MIQHNDLSLLDTIKTPTFFRFKPFQINFIQSARKASLSFWTPAIGRIEKMLALTADKNYLWFARYLLFRDSYKIQSRHGIFNACFSREKNSQTPLSLLTNVLLYFNFAERKGLIPMSPRGEKGSESISDGFQGKGDVCCRERWLHRLIPMSDTPAFLFQALSRCDLLHQIIEKFMPKREKYGRIKNSLKGWRINFAPVGSDCMSSSTPIISF